MKTKAKTNVRFHIMDEDFISVGRIAKHWGCSIDKASHMLEKSRGEVGFLELGSHEDVRKHKRRYSIIKISPALLTKIEASMRAHRQSK
jgi:hypothetical protein